jgi:transposase-like protein
MLNSYSREFKKAAVEKFLSRGSRTVIEVASEIGVAKPTLYLWQKELSQGTEGTMKKSKSPQNRSPEEKLKLLIGFENLSPESRGEFLRREGLYEETLIDWKEQIKRALIPDRKVRQEQTEKQRRIQELERELRRKDKALAETTALLVLKKKALSIWGEDE